MNMTSERDISIDESHVYPDRANWTDEDRKLHFLSRCVPRVIHPRKARRRPIAWAEQQFLKAWGEPAPREWIDAIRPLIPTRHRRLNRKKSPLVIDAEQRIESARKLAGSWRLLSQASGISVISLTLGKMGVRRLKPETWAKLQACVDRLNAMPEAERLKMRVMGRPRKPEIQGSRELLDAAYQRAGSLRKLAKESGISIGLIQNCTRKKNSSNPSADMVEKLRAYLASDSQS